MTEVFVILRTPLGWDRDMNPDTTLFATLELAQAVLPEVKQWRQLRSRLWEPVGEDDEEDWQNDEWPKITVWDVVTDA